MKFKRLKTGLSGSLAAIMLITLSTSAPATENREIAENSEIAAEVRKEVERILNDKRFMAAIIERGINDFIQKRRARAEADEQRVQSMLMQNMRPVSKDVDHIYGNPEAPVSLVEYSDFECPFCKRFHASAKKFIDKNEGKVNWIYRHFPLSGHNPSAQREAEASECAAELGGNDTFWQYSTLIYQRTKSGGKGLPAAQLGPLAESVGLDKGAFEKCLNSGKMAARIQIDIDNGVATGISGTPGNILIVNKTGKSIFLNGAANLRKLDATLTQLTR